MQILLEDVTVGASGIRGDPNETLHVDGGTYRVTGHEVWRDVKVQNSGRLLVVNGALLETSKILLGGFSTLEVRKAVLDISDRTYASEVGIFGECSYFHLVEGSRVNISGSQGAYDVNHSRGGNARIDLLVYTSAKVKSSTLDITGGNGLSPDRPMTTEDLDGDAFSGGDASVSINVTAYQPVLEIKGAQINLRGGDGGKAPDGLPPRSSELGGRGGGYTRGGDVSGMVGSGGEANLTLRSEQITMWDTIIELDGGEGGHAGAGGGTDASQSLMGSGGGGYTGGDGGTDAPSNGAIRGGDVSGEVGSGGDATVHFQGTLATIHRTYITATAGNGGDAGDGGASDTIAGGGGGGYSGGGGGTFVSGGGDGGRIRDDVGSGGDASINMSLRSLVLLNATSLTSTGGSGGCAGDGGDAMDQAGGGGGGYSGGGGGGRATTGRVGPGADGGDGGDVEGNVGAGGDATVVLVSGLVNVFDCHVTSLGGPAGGHGIAGEMTGSGGPSGGGGGAGYSGGGGAGTEGTGTNPGTPGSSGDLVGPLGNGGSAHIACYCHEPTITRTSTFDALPGEPGPTGTEPPDDPLRGGSAYRVGWYGSTHRHIPMSRPWIEWPHDGSEGFVLPRCLWTAVHDSTTNGPVSAYLLEIDDDPGFGSVDFSTTVTDNWAWAEGLDFRRYYIRVFAIYSDPPGTLGPEAYLTSFRFYNAPPVFWLSDPIYVNEGTESVVDLNRYISDKDTDLENLTMTTSDPAVRAIDGLAMRLYFDEPSDIQWIYFDLTDGYSRRTYKLPVVVLDVNDPPQVVSIGGLVPPVTLQVDEGSVNWFEIELLDPDGDDLTMSLYSSWRGYWLFSNGSLRVTTRQERFGQYSARLEVEDSKRALTIAEITVLITNVPDPPGPIEVYSPYNHTTLRELDSIPFTVKVNDPDLAWGEELLVSWTSNVTGQMMSIWTTDIASFHCNDLPVGDHRITITVWDGVYQRETYLDISIEERSVPSGDEPTSSEEIPPFLVALLIVMPMLGFFLGRRGVGHAR